MFGGSNQTKRKREDGSSAAAAAAAVLASPTQLQQRRQRHIGSPDGILKAHRRPVTTSSAPLTLHQQRCQSCFQQEMEFHNADMAKRCAVLQEILVRSVSSGTNIDGPPLGWENPCLDYVLAVEQTTDKYCPPVGDVLMCGSDECGQLGTITTTDSRASRPRLLKDLSNKLITHVTCGGLHNVALTQLGTAYTWGSNDDGALGRETPTDIQESVPTQVTGFVNAKNEKEDSSIISVAAGGAHSLYLSIHGNVYMSGCYKDSDGKSFRDLRPSNDKTVDVPRGQETKAKIPPLGGHFSPTHIYQFGTKKVTAIACGGCFSAAIVENDDDNSNKDSYNTLYTWGMGDHGEMGRRVEFPKKTSSKWTEAQLQHIANTMLQPTPVAWSLKTPPRVVVSVACGGFHMLVVARDSHDKLMLYSSGLNQYGQLGHGNQEPLHQLNPVMFAQDKNIAKVSAGFHHSMILDQSGKHLYTFGRADYGQLGLTDTAPQSGSFETLPQMVAFPSEDGPTVQITKIACGDNHSLCVSSDNTVYTWGYGDIGALGHGDPPGQEGQADEEQEEQPEPERNDENSDEEVDESKPPEPERDEYRPRKLLKKTGEKISMLVRQISGGGQHSAMVMTRPPTSEHKLKAPEKEKVPESQEKSSQERTSSKRVKLSHMR